MKYSISKSFFLRWFKIHLLIVLYLFVSTAQAQFTCNTLTQCNIANSTSRGKYGGYTLTNQHPFNCSDYLYYMGLTKTQAKKNSAIEYNCHSYLIAFSKDFNKYTKDAWCNYFRFARYLTAFVSQSISSTNNHYNNCWVFSNAQLKSNQIKRILSVTRKSTFINLPYLILSG